MARKSLPKNLRDQAAGRSDAAKSALQAAMDAWWSELEENGFAIDEPPTLKDMQLRAGLGEKFLYGPKHKETTKPWVEQWIEKVRTEASRRKKDNEEPEESEDAKYWQERYEKLARHANLWFVRMRQLQKRVRDLEGDRRVARLVTSEADE